MNSLRRGLENWASSTRRGRRLRRSGWIASSEVLVVLTILTGLVIAAHRGWTLVATGSGEDSQRLVRPVYGISLDFDGNHLWVHRLREDLVRVDLVTGAVTQSLAMPAIQLAAVAHSRDGSTTLVRCTDGAVILYGDGEMTGSIELPIDACFDAIVSGDETVAVTTTVGGHVHGCKGHPSKLREFMFDVKCSSDVLQIGLNSTGRRLFVARRDGEVSFHGLDAGDADGAILDVGAGGTAFAWSRDERLFAVVTNDLQVRLYDVLNGRLVSRVSLDDSSPRVTTAVMKFSPDGRRVAVSTQSLPTIYVWDVGAGTSVGRLCGHEGMVHTLQFSANSNRLYSGGYDGTIREWSLETHLQLRIID